MRDPANELARSLRRRKIPRISRETRRRFVRALRQPCRPRSAPTIPIDLLLPPNLRQWLPESQLAYQIGDLVDTLDLKSFYAPSKGDERRNSLYKPRMMVTVQLYGYATGILSSCRIAPKLEEGIAFRYVAAEGTSLE